MSAEEVCFLVPQGWMSKGAHPGPAPEDSPRPHQLSKPQGLCVPIQMSSKLVLKVNYLSCLRLGAVRRCVAHRGRDLHALLREWSLSQPLLAPHHEQPFRLQSASPGLHRAVTVVSARAFPQEHAQCGGLPLQCFACEAALECQRQCRSR